MPNDYANPANIYETVAEVRDQSGPQDQTSTGINFHRSHVSAEINTAYDMIQWQETKYGSPRTEADRIWYREGKAQDPTKQAPYQILRRHATSMVWDDTPFHERWAIYYRNGSYLEYRNSGVYSKARGDRDTIVTETDRIYVKGDRHMTVDGRHMVLVESDVYHDWRATLYETIKKDVIREVMGSIEEKVADKITQEVGNQKTVTVPTEVHEIGVCHKLQSSGDSVLGNDYVICSFTGKPHASINGKRNDGVLIV